MNEIVDLEKERARRAFEELIKGTKPFPCELDLTRREIMCSGWAAGSADDFTVSVAIYDPSTEPSEALGVVRFKPEQWLEFKKMGDALFDAHVKIAKQTS